MNTITKSNSLLHLQAIAFENKISVFILNSFSFCKNNTKKSDYRTNAVATLQFDYYNRSISYYSPTEPKSTVEICSVTSTPSFCTNRPRVEFFTGL